MADIKNYRPGISADATERQDNRDMQESAGYYEAAQVQRQESYRMLEDRGGLNHRRLDTSTPGRKEGYNP